MEYEQLIKVIETVSKSSLTNFQLEEEGFKISMKKSVQGQVVMQTASVPVSPEKREEELPEGNVVKAPLVGTFYASSSPEAEPFVKVGDTVKKGQVLGIIEAMKLMNEIESEYDGVVESILIENESLVEYGQPLFVIRS